MMKLVAFGAILISASGSCMAAPEAEPNDSATSANSIFLDANQTGTISPAKINSLSDVDYFKIVTPSFEGTTSLTVTMTPMAADKSLDAVVALRNAGNAVLASRDAGGDNVVETLTFSVAGGTTYYVTCSSADIFSLGTGDYSLSVSLVFNDPNDQLSEAIPVGAITRTVSVPQPAQIDPSPDVDMYSFVVGAGQRISFNIDYPVGGLSALIRLFDAAGNEIDHNTGGNGPGELPETEAYLEHTFQVPGTYYLGISGVGNSGYNATTGNGDTAGSNGSYTLVISPGIAGSIRRPNSTTDYAVDIVRFGTIPTAINPNLQTWIISHGWNSSRTEPNIVALVASLALSRPNDQILTLDWSAAADTGILNPFDAEISILPVSEWAAAALIQAGFKGTNLNLVGHSFGSYVSAEIAERLGGVNSIMTFDPAADVVGGYTPDENDQINFARDSNFSWSFHSSNFGSDQTPFTADEEFLVTGLDPVTAHGDVLFFFAFLLGNPNDAVSQFFFLSFLLNETYGPWIPDQFTSPFASDDVFYGYEADIEANATTHKAENINFVSILSDRQAVSIPEGDRATLGIKLSAQPQTDVRVETVLASGDSDFFIESGAALTFTTANWNQAQTITLAAAKDLDSSNGTGVLRFAVSGRAIRDVVMTEIDNDRLESHPRLGSTRIDAGQLRFSLEGESGTLCVIQSSADFKQWLPVSTNTIPSSGGGEISVIIPATSLFFRAQAIGKIP